MKKLLLFSLALLLMGATAWGQKSVKQAIHPDEVAYKIDGNFSYEIVGNDVLYKLTDVWGTGMVVQKRDPVQGFLNVDRKDVFQGEQPDNKEVGFCFPRIIPSEGFPGYDNISYWYYDTEIQEWQKDSEIRKSEMQQVTSKQVTVMLIIDCSSSLDKRKSEVNGRKNEDDAFFEKVKISSIKFLKTLLESSSHGNVHVGIVAFSSIPDTRMLPMQPLTSESVKEMEGFINSRRTENGTALFYAWDQAIQKTQDYVSSGNFDKSYFVTFTDGIDQTSQDMTHRPTPIVSADDYFKYIISDAQKTIKNYESDVVFVRGSDIGSDAQMEKFEKKLKQLAVPNDEEHYTRLNNMNQLEEKFDDIASRLTDSWKELTLYVAPARHGKVCWTFGQKEVKQEKPKVVKAKGKNFCGMSFGIGVNICNWSSGYNAAYSKAISVPINVGFDYAWRLSDRFAMGIYAVIGAGPSFYRQRISTNYRGYPDYDYDYKYYEGTDVAINLYVGLLMLFGNLDNKPFILGVTPFTGFSALSSYYPTSSLPLEVRFGRVLSDHFYLTGYAKMGVGIGFPFEPGLSFGYKF